MRTDSLSGGGDIQGDALISDHPAVYANHVDVAAYLRDWSDRMSPARAGIAPGNEDDYLMGYIRALRDLADHFVQGDALPGGPINLDRMTA